MAITLKYSKSYTPQKFCGSLYRHCKKATPSMQNKRSQFINNCKEDITSQVSKLNNTTYNYFNDSFATAIQYELIGENLVINRLKNSYEGSFSKFDQITNTCEKYGGSGGTPAYAGSEATAKNAYASGVYEEDDIWYSVSPHTLPIIISKNVASNIAINLTNSFRMAYGLKSFLVTAIEKSPLNVPTFVDQFIGTLGAYLKCFEVKWNTQAKQISDALIAQWSSNSDYPKHVFVPAFTPFSPIPTGPMNLTFSVPTFSAPATAFAY